MGSQLVNPNFHAALVHLPIGAFALGVLIELFGFLYPRSTVRPAARWMIALGALSMIPTALAGVYALGDVARRSLPPDVRPDAPWADVAAKTNLHQGRDTPADPEGAQWRLVSGHVWRTAPATAIAVLAVVVGIAVGDRLRRPIVGLPILAVLVFALAVLLWGAWMGGEMVYRWGTAVRLPETPPETSVPVQPGAAREQTEARSPGTTGYFVPPLQGHLVVAGFAVAAALGALGLSTRNATPIPVDEPIDVRLPDALADAVVRNSSVIVEPADESKASLANQPPAAPAMPAKSGRLWVAAALTALVAAGLGVWFLAAGTDAAKRAADDNRSLAAVLWDTVKTPAVPAPLPYEQKVPPPESPLGLNRRLAHVIAGGAIVLLPLVLAALAKWGPRQKVLLVATSFLLVAAIALQAWLGTVMLLDGPAGPLTRFQEPAVDPMAP